MPSIIELITDKSKVLFEKPLPGEKQWAMP